MGKILAVAFAVLAVACAVALAEQPKLHVTLPKSLRAKEVTRLPQRIGLPFGDFSKHTDAQILAILVKEFPIISSNRSTLLSGKGTLPVTTQVEAVRWAIFANALKQRNAPGDAAVLRVMAGDWECTACEFAVGQIKGKIADMGCALAAGIFGQVCDAIPVIGPFTMPECVAVLNWGCGQLLEDIEDGITSDSQLCNMVFGLQCS